MPAPRPVEVDARLAPMREELSAIRQMVGQVLERQNVSGGTAPKAGPSANMPRALFDCYLRMLSQDVSEEFADRIVASVRDELGPERLDDPELVRQAVQRQLSAAIPVATEPVRLTPSDGRPLTIALVGPTGVGKTTTLAKLAAAFKIHHGKRVGLITADTYRIAAVDQLQTYANIIGLPLRVALTPQSMSAAVASFVDCDVILIDTAGRSQNDRERLDELRAYLESARPHEVHLVLSGTASEKVLMREVDAFSKVGVDKVVLTKLDEAVSFGMLVSVIGRVGKKLSFITTGQEVPDHIEAGQADRLAALVMGAGEGT